MKITFKSEDPRAMDAFVREVVVAVKEAGGSVFDPAADPLRGQVAESQHLPGVAGKAVGAHAALSPARVGR